MRRRFCRPPRLDPALPLLPPRQPVLAPGPLIGARRILALHLPWLAAERRCIAQPWACWDTEGQRRVLTCVSREAAEAGLAPGMALADAQAMLPALLLEPAAAEADLAWLRRLALWAQCVTPLAAMNPPDGLLLDITGVDHLHGGEAALLRGVVQRFARAGLTVQAAIAGAPDCAAALARAGQEAVVPPGGEAAAIAPLPLALLRLPPAQVAALHRLGLRRVEEVLRQPRGPLARRFGQVLVETLDAATGQRPRPLQPLRPPAQYLAAREFLEPIVTREAIDAVLDGLLAKLCRQLAAGGLGARRLVLRAFRVDGMVQAVVVGTGLPAREPRHFARLFREKLEGLAPGFGFQRLALEARLVAPMDGAQSSLPGRDGLSAEARQEALAQLLDRLGQRLPVWRLAPRASHWPERQAMRLGPFEAVETPEGWGQAPRPVRLLRRPLELQAVAMLPDAPPLLLRHGRIAWRVKRAEGPERIAPEWWRDRPDRPFRDYYRIELEGGARLWVCRAGLAQPEAPAGWWLHGRFA